MWFLSALGFLLLLAFVRLGYYRWRASSWPLAEGRVEKIEEAYFPNERRRQGQTYDKRPKGKRFSVRLEYSFTIANERYGGFAGLWGFDEKDFAVFSDQVRVGAVVFVRYDAENPDESEVRIQDNPPMQHYGVHTILGSAAPPDPGSVP